METHLEFLSPLKLLMSPSHGAQCYLLAEIIITPNPLCPICNLVYIASSLLSSPATVSGPILRIRSILRNRCLPFSFLCCHLSSITIALALVTTFTLSYPSGVGINSLSIQRIHEVDSKILLALTLYYPTY